MLSSIIMTGLALALLYIESKSQVHAFQPCHSIAANKKKQLAAEVEDMFFSTNPVEETDVKRAHECVESIGSCSIEELEQLKNRKCQSFSITLISLNNTR